MKELAVDRFEGIYCICEDNERNIFALPLADVPSGVMSGDILKIDEQSGTITIDKVATDRRRSKMRTMEGKLFK